MNSSVPIQQHLMPARVPRRRDAQQVVIQPDRLFPGDNAFDPSPCRFIAGMHDARTVEMRGELRMVRDVVAMREPHQADAAHLLETLDERRGEARRVDQDVPAFIR